MCLNGDIERQFEFVQQTWAMALQFHGPRKRGRSPADAGQTTGRLTVPTAKVRFCIQGFQDCVRMRGGGYFFIPGRRALHYLCS